MDGVAPELSPGWAHRRINTYPEVPHAPYELKTKALSMLCACRTALVLFFPQRDILSRFGRCAIHGYACHRPSTARSDPLCCSLDVRMSLFYTQVSLVLALSGSAGGSPAILCLINTPV